MKSSILNFKIIVLIIILQFATNGDAQSKGNETKKSVPADGNREEKCEWFELFRYTLKINGLKYNYNTVMYYVIKHVMIYLEG